MREIKFRAWDKEKKRFGYVTFHPGKIAWPNVSFMASGLMLDRADCAEGVMLFDVEDFQQFTGLRDVLGKEIYEGDIVQWVHYTDQEQQTVVEDIHTLCHGFFDGQLGRYEVIGNIYENPELLTK